MKYLRILLMLIKFIWLMTQLSLALLGAVILGAIYVFIFITGAGSKPDKMDDFLIMEDLKKERDKKRKVQMELRI